MDVIGNGWSWVDVRGNRRPWVDVRNNGRPWVNVEDNGRHWVNVRGNGSSWMDVRGNGSPWGNVRGNGKLWVDVIGNGWQLVVLRCNERLLLAPITPHIHPWLPIASPNAISESRHLLKVFYAFTVVTVIAIISL